MPGPNSAPNGDRRLVGSNILVCIIHGEKQAGCSTEKGCRQVRLREFLHSRNRLARGKTSKTKGR